MAPNSRTFILTGATGFLGSHLMAALLARGHRLIVLGRAANGTSLAARIDQILEWFDLADHRHRLETAEVDLLLPQLGIDQAQYQYLCRDVDQLIHCASDTGFSERNRANAIATNVTSLHSIITLAKDSSCSRLHYISTAYSAGISTTPCREKPCHATRFFNSYEETKAEAEKLISARCTALGIPITIIRPSIVYGDSRSGRANRFTAIYHHVRSLACIRDIYHHDLLNQGGKKSARYGISLGNDGRLHLPLRLVLEQPGSINLIPVDYFVAATLAIMAQGEPGTIYHLTSDTPSTMEELAAFCERYLRMQGIRIAYGQTGYLPSPAEELFNRFIEPYRPYLSDTRLFDRRNTDLATAGLSPPQFSYEIFSRCMDYAQQVDWGKNLYDSCKPDRAC